MDLLDECKNDKERITVADSTSRLPGNESGDFYVDSTCIACVTCVTVAPECFSMKNSNEHSIVYKQPSNEEEYSLCIEALELCPVSAIGDDG
ncbi:ferredoxin [Paenibacillus polysaccharolyticus]|uniref:ferredoxin n=1 Tax=Paenibacillus polysaccharolyticus TaxID=582692 RepID=UPI002959A556|nr:ferredoxin [Paenibacillus intestini]